MARTSVSAIRATGATTITAMAITMVVSPAPLVVAMAMASNTAGKA